MKHLQLELAPPSAVIMLNRPNVRSALSASLIEEFQRVLSEIEREKKISSVIVTASGSSFCGGADLADLGRMTSLSAEKARRDTLVLIDLLLQQVGERRARELLLTGRVLSPLEARDIGLVNEVVPPGDLMDHVHRLAEIIAKHSAGAVVWTKHLLGQLRGLGLEEALALAAQWNVVVRNTEDFKEGVSSFLEKRPPVWRK